jgi:hypothetical protein
LVLDWQIGMGLADWLGIGRLVMDLQICSGLGSYSWIGNESPIRQSIANPRI